MNGQKASKPIALIKTGTTIPEIKQAHGDFESWFAEGMGIFDLFQVDVYRQESLPVATDLAGIVITGSPSMVSEKENWSENTGNWLAQAVQKEVPVLGVCYGHQLLAQALGGHVGPNPEGRQIGTVKGRLLESADSDALLGHLPRFFPAHSSHSEVVLDLPPGAERLATSPLTDNFAVRFAENVWGLQFHPEFSVPVMSKYIRYRADDLRKEGLCPDKLQSRTTETDEASSVLLKFANTCRDS